MTASLPDLRHDGSTDPDRGRGRPLARPTWARAELRPTGRADLA